MKKLLVLVFLAFIGCTKTTNELAKPGNFFFYGNARDASFAPIQGARMTCDVIKFKGGSKKSVSITMYTDNNYFVQTGFHTFNNSTVPFVQVWQNGQQVGVNATFLANPPLAFGQKQSFSIYNVAGTTKWRTTRDTTDCIEFELFSQSGNRAELYTEVGPTGTPGSFPRMNFYPALETLSGGVWNISQSAYVSSSAWGLQGYNQNNSLKIGEVNVGGNLPIIPAGTYLWSSLD